MFLMFLIPKSQSRDFWSLCVVNVFNVFNVLIVFKSIKNIKNIKNPKALCF